MLLVAIALPGDAGAIERAGRRLGLSAADLRNRLQGVLPRVLASDADADRLSALSDDLDGLGFATAVCDARAAPTDDERVVARSARLERDELVVVDGAGGEHACPFAAIAAFQRAVRVTTEVTKETTTERKLDVGRAILTSGLVLTRKEKKVTTRKTETSEPLLLLQRNDGEPDVVFYERRLDYRFLGRDMQPASRANLEMLARRLRLAARGAPYDDRAARPGFVSALPAAPVDGVDLALFLVTLALRRGR
jgi:hypothetical protein